MKASDRIKLKQSERRQKLAKLAEVENPTDEQRTEMEALTTEYRAAETQLQAAIIAEAEERNGINPGDGDAEVRELADIRGRVSLSRYVAAAVELRAVDGAEAEFNGALGIEPGRFPLELLAPPEQRAEQRTTTDVDAKTTQQTWLDRLFADTAAMRLGVTFESVAPGVSAHPVTTAGASAAQRGRGEAAADAAWTVGVTEIKPTRNAVRAVFSDEDTYRLPGLEEALRRDLGAALTEGVDRAIFLGDDGANEDVADITGLQTLTGVSEQTITQVNKVKGEGVAAAFAALIDGKHAGGLADLNVVAAVGAARLWISENITGASGAPQTLAKYLMDAGLSWMTRGDIEDATTADKFAAFVGRRRGIAGAAVAAIWNQGMLIRDPYSGASKGEVALTLATYWGFKVPRPANFARVKFVA